MKPEEAQDCRTKWQYQNLKANVFLPVFSDAYCSASQKKELD